MQKTCGQCGLVKALGEFYKDKTSPDGHRRCCKECVKENARENCRNNKERHAEACRDYATRNRERINATQRKWASRNPEKRKAAVSAYLKANRKKLSRKSIAWGQRNKSRVNANRRAWRASGRDYDYTRRLRTGSRTPTWTNRFFIAEIYDLARRRTKATGIKHHVDHFFPLAGKTISGLHVETNLRVIPGSVNCRKSNKFPEIGDIL